MASGLPAHRPILGFLPLSPPVGPTEQPGEGAGSVTGEEIEAWEGRGRGTFAPAPAEFLQQSWVPVLLGADLLAAAPSPCHSAQACAGLAPEPALGSCLGLESEASDREAGSRELTVAAASCFQGQRWQQRQLHACSPWLSPQMFPEARLWLRWTVASLGSCSFLSCFSSLPRSSELGNSLSGIAFVLKLASLSFWSLPRGALPERGLVACQAPGLGPEPGLLGPELLGNSRGPVGASASERDPGGRPGRGEPIHKAM